MKPFCYYLKRKYFSDNLLLKKNNLKNRGIIIENYFRNSKFYH